MGLLGGLNKLVKGVVKTGIGVAADVVTLGTNAIDDELYTAKGAKTIKDGLEEIFEDED